jgi:hypothetical protein
MSGNTVSYISDYSYIHYGGDGDDGDDDGDGDGDGDTT